MDSDNKQSITQAVTPDGKSAADSDRVFIAPVVGAASSGSGRGNLSQESGKTTPFLQVPKLRLTRTNSQSSQESKGDKASGQQQQDNVFKSPPSRTGSVSSVYTEGSELAPSVVSQNKRDSIAIELKEARAKTLELMKSYGQIEKTIAEMYEVSQEKQKNIKACVKEGIANIHKWIPEMKEKHFTVYCCLQGLETDIRLQESHRTRRQEEREKAHAEALENAVANAQKKRKASTPEAEPRKRRRKKKARQDRKTKQDATDVTDSDATPDKEDKNEDATNVQRTTAEKPAKRTTTLFLKVEEGRTYADVLGKLRKEVNPEAEKAMILSARPTPRGNLLLRLHKKTDRATFTTKVTEVVQGLAQVKEQERKVTLEIRDLDSLTEKADVECAVIKALQKRNDERLITVLKPNRRGLKLALVITSQEEAEQLLKLGHVRVGFTSNQVRKRIIVQRCARCLGYGHHYSQCEGKDRTKSCFKCGKNGHKAFECTARHHCFLCAEEKKKEKQKNKKDDQDGRTSCDHIAGSGSCKVFRRALEAAKAGARSQVFPRARRRKKNNLAGPQTKTGKQGKNVRANDRRNE